MKKIFLGGVEMDFVVQEIEQKVNDVLDLVTVEENKMLDTDEIKRAVEKISKTNIKVFSMPFVNKLGEAFRKCGAITQLSKDASEYNIILNSDMDVKYQRFSLVHEFGHIILNVHTFQKGEFLASFHINYEINHLSRVATSLDPIFENEEKANIFALCVLMPKRQFKNSILKYNLESVATIFGVTESAVKARFELLSFN